ncbi:MAG: stage II sporulation protein R [Firmicutes bacterium]|nr:stage II sporulation protein R [Bacillota bacterium]
MKKILISVLIAIAALLLPFMPTKSDAEIYNKTIRLHVLAASDSERDQTLKLKVRDNILVYASSALEGCKTREEADERLSGMLGELKDISEKTLRENNCNYEVTVSLSDEHYPTREYESVRLPAGTYRSLRIRIGEAEGKNWWCVLFPPLCTKKAEARDSMVEVGFTENQIRILTDAENPRYVLKFRILEILGELFGR